MLDTAYVDLLQPRALGHHLDVDVDHLFGLDESLFDGGITQHREGQFDGVLSFDDQLIVAVLVGRSALQRIGDVDQLDASVVVIGHIAVYASMPREQCGRAAYSQ